MAHSLIVVQVDSPCLGQLIDCENFSSLYRLLRVTTLVLKFDHLLRLKVKRVSETVLTDGQGEIERARLYWLRDAQSQLPQDSKFSLWKRQFDLHVFIDKSQLWRCGGRMSNSNLPSSAKTPILLDKKHPFTALIVMDAH